MADGWSFGLPSDDDRLAALAVATFVAAFDISPFEICEATLCQPVLNQDATFLVFSNDPRIYFPANLLPSGRLHAGEFLIATLFRHLLHITPNPGPKMVTRHGGGECPSPAVLVYCSFVLSVSIRLSRLLHRRPLTDIERLGWPAVAQKANDLSGNPVQIAVAAVAERDDLRAVVYTAARELAIITDNSNSAASRLLAIATADRPWRVPWDTPFWHLLVSVIQAADITILPDAVRYIKEPGHSHAAANPGSPPPHIAVGKHVAIWLSPVDWELLTILLCFGDSASVGHTSLTMGKFLPVGTPRQLEAFVSAVNDRRAQLAITNPNAE